VNNTLTSLMVNLAHVQFPMLLLQSRQTYLSLNSYQMVRRNTSIPLAKAKYAVRTEYSCHILLWVDLSRGDGLAAAAFGVNEAEVGIAYPQHTANQTCKYSPLHLVITVARRELFRCVIVFIAPCRRRLNQRHHPRRPRRLRTQFCAMP
jgi:hypothetical protein